jgi:hypothetical protein
MSKLRKGHIVTEATRAKIRAKRALQTIPKESYKKRGLKYSGKNHWNWKGGITDSPETVYGEKWHDIRLAVYKRDNYICQKCGIKCTNKPGKTMIQCHHIDSWRNSKNNDMKNLTTLCLSCHTKEDFRHNRKVKI